MKRLLIFALFATTLLAVGCKKDDPVNNEDRPRTFLHVLSAIQADTFDLTLDYFNSDDVVIKDFVYGRNFPIVGYADLEASGTPDEFDNGKLYAMLSYQPFLNMDADTLMEPRAIVLEADEKSTICYGDSLGTITYLKVKDEYSFPNDTTAAVRFINLSNGNATASLGSVSGAVSIPNVNFWSESQFMNFSHGQYQLQFLDANGAAGGSVSLWLAGGTAYTFYAVGNSLAYFIN